MDADQSRVEDYARTLQSPLDSWRFAIRLSEIILELTDRVQTLEEKLDKMSKKNKEAKVREPKTDDYICNDALYYQSALIGKHRDLMKVTNHFNGTVDVTFTQRANGETDEMTYQVNEVTWRMWLKEKRVVKACS